MMYFGFENVTVSYKNRRVLDGVTIDIPKGKIVTVIGRNGCGKSTLLKTVFGTVRPDSGSTVLEGKKLHSYPTNEVARRIGYLAQSPAVPQGMDVRSLAACGRFPFRKGGSSKEDERIIDETLQVTGLTGLQHRQLASLSGGERQRAWLTMALCRKPEILILDEPTTYLDISCRLEILELVQRLNREKGMTVLMVLHDLDLAARYSDTLIALHEGKVFAEGTPREVLCKQTLREVFGVEARLLNDGEDGYSVVIPVRQQEGDR